MRTLENVEFKVAGTYAYKGDFIITQGVLYFLPHTDLIQQHIDTVTNKILPRIDDTIANALGVVGDVVGTIIDSLIQPDVAHNDGLPGIRNTDHLFQQKMDAYITEMKESRAGAWSSSDLPLPLRYEKAEIKNLRVTSAGVLSFDARYDTHVYRFGTHRESDLRVALIQSGFLS